MAEWLMAADCKSAVLTCYGGSNPSLPTISFGPVSRGSSAAAAASLFENAQLLGKAHVAQLVEHVLGKDGVSSSNLLVGSISTTSRGSNSVVESQPSKLLVAGSIPVSRSSTFSGAVPDTFDIVTRELGIDSATQGGLPLQHALGALLPPPHEPTPNDQPEKRTCLVNSSA